MRYNYFVFDNRTNMGMDISGPIQRMVFISLIIFNYDII